MINVQKKHPWNECGVIARCKGILYHEERHLIEIESIFSWDWTPNMIHKRSNWTYTFIFVCWGGWVGEWASECVCKCMFVWDLMKVNIEHCIHCCVYKQWCVAWQAGKQAWKHRVWGESICLPRKDSGKGNLQQGNSHQDWGAGSRDKIIVQTY